jgi:hypothetical protein
MAPVVRNRNVQIEPLRTVIATGVVPFWTNLKAGHRQSLGELGRSGCGCCANEGATVESTQATAIAIARIRPRMVIPPQDADKTLQIYTP